MVRKILGRIRLIAGSIEFPPSIQRKRPAQLSDQSAGTNDRCIQSLHRAVHCRADLQLGQSSEEAVRGIAVADAFGLDAGAVEHGDVEIGHGGGVCEVCCYR